MQQNIYDLTGKHRLSNDTFDEIFLCLVRQNYAQNDDRYWEINYDDYKAGSEKAEQRHAEWN
jgi:hypothetical protein